MTFSSGSTNLVPNDTNGYEDIFIRDIFSEITERISISSNGTQTNYSSYASKPSDDGRYILFDSVAYNLEPNMQYTGNPIAYIRDRLNRQTLRVTSRTLTNNITSYGGLSMTPDGKYLVFEAGPSIYKVNTQTIITGDTTPPVVTGMPDRSANNNGWYNAPVTITWLVIDPSPSSGAPTNPPSTTANLEGTNTYVSGQSCDPVGNCSTGSLALSIDTVLPAGAFNGNAAIVRFLGHRIVGISVDATSGIDMVEVVSGATTLSSASGSISLSCNTDRTNCSWDANPATLPSGSQTLTLKITDKAGNIYTTTKNYIII